MLNETIIGMRVAEGRKEQKLSQAQFAQKLCVSPQAVSKWERGESMPDIIMLDRIAKLFNKDMNYFTAEPAASENAAHIDDEYRTDFADGAPDRDDDGKTWQGGEDAHKRPTINMSMATWRDADFSGLNNIGDKFSFSNVLNCKFKESALAGTRFSANNIKDCDFTLANLEYCTLRGSNIVGNRFDGCKLDSIKIGGANVKNCSFIGANLTRAEFKGTNVQGCDFTGATLDGARLKTTNIKEANFENTSLDGAEFNCCNFNGITFTGDFNECAFISCTFKNTYFKNVTFKNCFFKGGDMFGKMLSKIKFESCKADKLSYEFLRACKADLSGIELV